MYGGGRSHLRTSLHWHFPVQREFTGKSEKCAIPFGLSHPDEWRKTVSSWTKFPTQHNREFSHGIREPELEARSSHHAMGHIGDPGLNPSRMVSAIRADALKTEEIKTICEAAQVLQPVFARYVNVSKNLVSDWERWTKRLGGLALRLLSIILRWRMEDSRRQFQAGNWQKYEGADL